MRRLLTLLIVCLTPFAAKAATLKIVNVGAPAINCVFNAACTVSISDLKDNFPLSAGGTGVFQSRTFKGLAGSPAAGLFAYEYRVDLRNAVGVTALSCVDWVSVGFGPVVSTLDFNADKKTDQVFVINNGGLGTIGLASAVQTGRTIRFKFKTPVCAGSSAGKGDSTFFWGLVSKKHLTSVTATIHETSGVTHAVKARAPQ
ncbi:MAG TPA: hypothetical protein VJT71_07775 [Pyrinomonadaceae bacterium]|nr:hypothetical protein [Pyrinomonadaceae bacterium]